MKAAQTTEHRPNAIGVRLLTATLIAVSSNCAREIPADPIAPAPSLLSDARADAAGDPATHPRPDAVDTMPLVESPDAGRNAPANASDGSQPIEVSAPSADAGTVDQASRPPNGAGDGSLAVDRPPEIDGGSGDPPPSLPTHAADLARGRIGHWHLDEFGGTAAIDSGPIGNHGATLGLSDEDWRPGRLHNGLTFKPQQRSLVVVGAHASLNPSRAVSVALWVNARSWQGRPCLLEKGDDFQEYGLGIRQNQLQFFVRLNEGQTVRATAPLPRVNEWTHIAAIYDGQAAFLLVDGELLRSARAAGHPAAAHHDLTIGGRRSGNATAEDFFAGMIDEVLLYARALSLEEVRSLAAGKAP